MGFFTAARQGRKDDAELGKGLWRRAHDRFHRRLDRYHQELEGVEDEQLYVELVEVANELAELSGRVRRVCVEAQRRSPSDGLDIPHALSGVHRALSKAGTRWLPLRRQRRCSASLSVPFRWVPRPYGAVPKRSSSKWPTPSVS